MPPKIKTKNQIFDAIGSGLKHAIRFPNIHEYVPHEKQLEFHSSSAHGRLFIGGNRSGKTVGGGVETIWYATGKHPHKRLPWLPPVRLRVVTVDFIDGLEQIVKPEIKKWLPPSELINGSFDDSYDKQERLLTLENGSTIHFMSYEQAIDKFAGTSLHGIWFDEEPPKDIWIECKLRLLDTNGDWWVTMTPVEGMTWTFDDIYSRAGIDPNIFVVEVDMDDNPHLSEEGKQVVLSGLSDEDVKKRKHGQYISRGGLIYTEFDPKKHVIEPIGPPLRWTKFNMMDHGTTNPTAWLWGAVDGDGRVLIYDEHYEGQRIVAHHAKVVKQKNLDYGIVPAYNVGDPSIRSKDPITGTSVQLEYMENGVPILLGNNNVIAGIDRVKKKLIGIEDKESDIQIPQLYITRNCVNTIWEIRRYKWAVWSNKQVEREKNRKEEPQKKDDHAMDALRYGIASRPEREDGTVVPDLPGLPADVSEGVNVEEGLFDKEVSSVGNKRYKDYHLGEEF